MNFTQSLQVGLHMIVEDDHYKIAVSYKNPTDEQLSVRTMDGRLFRLTMEGANKPIWSPDIGAAQAVTHWTFEPNSRATRHYDVPNEEMAAQKADELMEEFEHLDMERPNYRSVDPPVEKIIRLQTTVPSSGRYFRTVTRQYDLRVTERDLDNQLPDEQMKGVNRS